MGDIWRGEKTKEPTFNWAEVHLAVRVLCGGTEEENY